jgi:conjugative relaxase-like TrwC/TraI family protein
MPMSSQDAGQSSRRTAADTQTNETQRTPLHQLGARLGRLLSDTGLEAGVGDVLSIGKLAAGQARYYPDQAEARVDVVQSVGDGFEDYYGGEARGEWRGAAARALGLVGQVEGEALRRVLAGRAPWSDEALRDWQSRTRVAGFDLTFSAPKSVSVIFGVGDPAVAAAVRRGHERAVAEALGYLERSAAAVRRGHGGATVHETGGLVAAAFRHRTSRMGDPQLHTHLLVANLGCGPDGRWSALDARRIYEHAQVASFVYQAVLRGELTRELGLGVDAGAGRDRRGRWRAGRRDAGVQSAAGADRGGARGARDRWRACGGGGCARDQAREGAARER